MTGWIRDSLSCDSGATAIEYTLVAGMIALVIIAAVTGLGAELQEMLQGVADSF